MTTNIKEHHTEKHEGKVEGFGLKILLTEEHRSKKETDDNRATTHHRDNADHGIRQREGIEIDKVGSREKQAHAYDSPVPMERRGTVMLRPP